MILIAVEFVKQASSILVGIQEMDHLKIHAWDILRKPLRINSSPLQIFLFLPQPFAYSSIFRPFVWCKGLTMRITAQMTCHYKERCKEVILMRWEDNLKHFPRALSRVIGPKVEIQTRLMEILLKLPTSRLRDKRECSKLMKILKKIRMHDKNDDSINQIMIEWR